MSFLKKRFGKSKTKQIRSDSDLTLQKGMDQRKATETIGKPVVRSHQAINITRQITLLEEKLNTPETRSTPPNHISIIRQLARTYMKAGEKDDITYFVKAENLFKQMNVLYPLHMEKIDWVTWIEASAKARLIREARRLLEEARLLFPGDEELDRIETDVLHITANP
jgi:hypothetical protein